MIVSTFLNLFIIPVLYTVVRGWLPMKVKVQATETPQLAEKTS